MNSDEPDIIINVPVPHLDVDERTLVSISRSFKEEGLRCRVSGVDRYAVAECWIEVAISIGSLIAAHYFDKILNQLDDAAKERSSAFVSKVYNAIDGLVRSKFDQICLVLRIGKAGREIVFPRRNKEEAHKAIRNALFEMRNQLDWPSGKIYWLDEASFPDDGPISLKLTQWGWPTEGTISSHTPGY